MENVVSGCAFEDSKQVTWYYQNNSMKCSGTPVKELSDLDAVFKGEQIKTSTNLDLDADYITATLNQDITQEAKSFYKGELISKTFTLKQDSHLLVAPDYFGGHRVLFTDEGKLFEMAMPTSAATINGNLDDDKTVNTAVISSKAYSGAELKDDVCTIPAGMVLGRIFGVHLNDANIYELESDDFEDLCGRKIVYTSVNPIHLLYKK